MHSLALTVILVFSWNTWEVYNLTSLGTKNGFQFYSSNLGIIGDSWPSLFLESANANKITSLISLYNRTYKNSSMIWYNSSCIDCNLNSVVKDLINRDYYTFLGTSILYLNIIYIYCTNILYLNIINKHITFEYVAVKNESKKFIVFEERTRNTEYLYFCSDCQKVITH